MRLFGLDITRLKKVQDRTNGSRFFGWSGGTTAGKAVNAQTAMQLSAVYGCVRVLAESMACLPLHLFRYTEKGGSEKATGHSLYQVLHIRPNPEMTSYQWREAAMTHLLLWGNHYSQIIRNERGDVIGLYPLMPDRMTVDRDAVTKQLVYKYYPTSTDPDLKIKNSSMVVLTPHDVLHIPGLGFDGLVGYSPITMAKNTIATAISAEEYGAKFFANGASPSGVLEHPGTLKDPKKLRDAWNSAYGGSVNSHKVAVLEEGVKYQPISINPQDAQFLETRKFQVDDIARIYRVPPHLIGNLEHATFSNIEHQSLEFVTYTLNPWVSRWEQSMEFKLLNPIEERQMFIEFNLEGLLRGDLSSRNSAYAVARQNGWMSANDIRRKEGMDLIPTELGGDRYLCNGNMVDIGSAGINK